MFGSLDAFSDIINKTKTDVNNAISNTTIALKRGDVAAAIGRLSSLEDVIPVNQRNQIEMQVSQMKRQLDSQPQQQQFMPQMPSTGFFGLTANVDPTIALVNNDLRQVSSILDNMLNAATQVGYTGMMGQSGMMGMGNLFQQNMQTPEEMQANQKLMSQVMSELPLLVNALSHLKHIAFVLGHQEYAASPYQSRNMQGLNIAGSQTFNQLPLNQRMGSSNEPYFGGRRTRRSRRRKQRGGCNGYSSSSLAFNAAPFTGGRRSRRRKSHKKRGKRSHRR